MPPRMLFCYFVSTVTAGRTEGEMVSYKQQGLILVISHTQIDSKYYTVVI